jgi:dipeptidyl aminopeptidase/acylaminoacyl peptidase
MQTTTARIAALLVILGMATATASPAVTAGAAAEASPAPSATIRHPLEIDDLYRQQDISDPRVSPDGAWVAYVVTTNDRAADEPRSAVWMVSWDGKQRLALTNPAHGTHAPRWSPDGRSLAYLASPAGSERTAIMLLDRRGGEARVLYDTKDDVGDYAWSPDGSRLVLAIVTSTDAGKSPRPIVIDAQHFKQDEDGYLATGAQHHLYVLTVADGKIAPLTEDASANDDLPTWSPDGKSIAFVRTHTPGADNDGREEIDLIDARGAGKPVSLAHPFAPNVQQLAWSPNGKLLAYLQGLEPKYNAYMQDRLAVIAVDAVDAAGAVGGAGGPGAARPRALSDALDRAVMSYAFSADSRSIIAGIEDDGSLYPVSIDLASGAITKLAPGPFVVSDLTAAAGHVAALYSDDRSPAEVYALEGAKRRKLTDHNDALLAQLRLGEVANLSFKSRDGTEIHGFVVKPPGFVAGRKYPTLLWIHGGPNGQDEHTFAFDAYQFRRQMLAAQGYLVVGINYRGSSGRGAHFAQEIFADWGHKEVEDLLAGIDGLEASGLADPAQLGIGGWSYGGILTDYTIASDQRFKGAISGAGSANQISMYGGDQYILQYNAELAPPWVDTAVWLKVSYPFFHADRIHTPTLFMGGDKDFNVPIIGGEQMYEALRTLGVPTQLIVYPGEYHQFKRPSFLVDRLQRVFAWFDHYVRGTAASPQPAASPPPVAGAQP